MSSLLSSGSIESGLGSKFSGSIRSEDDDVESGVEMDFDFEEGEDPGPGNIGVIISGYDTRHEVSKRSLASKSQYFRSYLARFHSNEKTDVVTLNSDFVSLRGWEYIQTFIQFNKFDPLEQDVISEDAIEVLEAANYLQIESLQSKVVKYIKTFINKVNHLHYYNNFVSTRGIQALGNFIKSTIIKPAEQVRKRKYGKFDLTVSLGHFDFKCHKAVLSAASSKIKDYITANPSCEQIDGTKVGVNFENAQNVYNLLELVYLDSASIIGFTSVFDAISVFQVLQDFKFSSKYVESCLSYLKRKVNMENIRQVYLACKQTKNEDLINLVLYFIMFKIGELKDLFLELRLPEVCKILASSYLNVKDEMEVVKLATEWIGRNDKDFKHARAILCCVRWARFSSIETDYVHKCIVMDFRLSSIIRDVADDVSCQEPREWPQLLVLAELLQRDQDLSLSYHKEYKLHYYESSTKKWELLTQDNGCFTMDLDVFRDVYGSISVAKVSSDTLVLTRAAPRTMSALAIRSLPFLVSVYNVWSDTWSFPYQDSRESSIEGTKGSPPSHTSVGINNVFYTALKSTENKTQDVISLHSIKHLYSSSPIYSSSHKISENPTTEPVKTFSTDDDSIHMVNGTTIHSYTISSNQWSQTAASPSFISDSGWLGLKDGRVVRVGGFDSTEKKTTNKCYLYNSINSKPKAIGGLKNARVNPSLTEYKGFLFTIGGTEEKISRKRKRSSSLLSSIFGDESMDEYQPFSAYSEIVRKVEYYVPELDCWSKFPDQPPVSWGTKLSLVSIDKPIRMMDLTFTPFRGLKRKLNE